MDRLGPSTAFKVRGATRGQGRAHSDQRTWWRGLRIADRRKTSTLRLLVQVTGLHCQLRRSTQHLLGVYSQGSGILKFFLDVDSSAARPGRAALESRQTGRFPWGSIALEGGLCFRLCTRISRDAHFRLLSEER